MSPAPARSLTSEPVARVLTLTDRGAKRTLCPLAAPRPTGKRRAMADTNQKRYDFLTDIAKEVQQKALDDEERQLVIEGCVGLLLLNFPPVELVNVVLNVSAKLVAIVEKSNIEDIEPLLKYVASTEEEYFGVLPEKPKRRSNSQLIKALQSDNTTVSNVPPIAIHLNAHRTVLKLIAGIQNFEVVVFKSGTKRTNIKGGLPTTSYGAFNLTEVTIGLTQKHVPASAKYEITYPDAYDHGLPHVGSDSITSRDLLRLAKWAGLTPIEERWYCLGILGFLLAPAAHSFREVAAIVDANQIAMFEPQYRYCGFFGHSLSRQPWFEALLETFRGRGFYGDLPFLCDILMQKLGQIDLVKLVLFFMDLPYVKLPIEKVHH
jgi:hypothetical protein